MVIPPHLMGQFAWMQPALILVALLLLLSGKTAHAFLPNRAYALNPESVLSLSLSSHQRPVSLSMPALPTSTGRKEPTLCLSYKSGDSSSYARQSQTEIATTKKPLYPSAGDIVRYYDIDGGRPDGEVLVGKISFIQKNLGKENSWLIELSELENVGDGYYAEYPSRQRSRKKTTRPLEQVSPIAASFVRSENAFKIPRNLGTGVPEVRAEQYDVDGYQGPFSGENAVDPGVIAQDAELYGSLKNNLIRNAALAGVVGTAVADLVKGSQDATIYAAGAAAGVAYLFFLSVKTDTLGSADAKLGSNVSNLRFILPVLVVVGVALYNKSLGDANPIQSGSFFETVTAEQFAAAVIGFLTYRIPLFGTQIAEYFVNDDTILPGSAGLALKLAQGTEEETSDATGSPMAVAKLTPILLISGPTATGRSELVARLLEQGDGRFVSPKLMDRNQAGANFERMEVRDEFLQIDKTGRFGLTKEGVLNAATPTDDSNDQVVVVDADVDLAKKLTRLSSARIIGVWVGLDSVEKFESRLRLQVESGNLPIPEGESKESAIRAKVKEIVRDIEYGLVSGIFEFTILNDDPENSIKELRAAAEYCFK